MKVLLSWIREFVDLPESAEDIGKKMGVRGLPLEGLDHIGDDAVLDFEVYANRPDTLSHIGIAREIATAFDRPLKMPAYAPIETRGSLSITIDDSDLCARYIGALAEVKVGPSPKWMQDRLTACGVRPISNIVDITNYVMLEIGQPMHAFDFDKMKGGVIKVRRAKPGEAMTTLDGKKRTLTANMIAIADAENAEDIGGVMGGANSEVSDATKLVAFEAAWFNPESIRATSKALGLKSEASTRFERGADRTAPPRAMARALELLEKIGAGKATGTITDTYPNKYQPKTMKLERKRIPGLLGMEVPDTSVTRVLSALGFDAKPAGEGWDVTIPSWRVDIQRQVDLIEEVGRHHGFEHLPTTFPGVQQAPPPSDPRITRDRRVRHALLGMGFSESITFAFIEDKAAAPFLEGNAPVAIANPLSEKFTTMRPSLLAGLIDSVSHNRRHGRRDVRLFEIGTRFSPKGETRGAAVAWTGLATPDHWVGGRRDVEFIDLKGVAEQIAAVSGVTPFDYAQGGPSFAESSRSYFVPGRAADLIVNGEVVGTFGQLQPSIAESRELPAADPIYVAEFNLDRLTALAPEETLRAVALPKYPAVVRDVSILIDESLSAETVRGTIRSAAPNTLTIVREFDRYQGKGVPDGKVSLSLRLTFQSPERTLTDDDVQSAMTRIVGELKEKLSAVQR